jgi:SNF2 family DNA or RNA helicase
VIVTSYATMRIDIEQLHKRRFAYVILDEAQTIKNPDSQLARAARLLQGEHRLALTGTPVENHLGDLGSIFEFLNPGMLGDVAALRRLGTRAAAAPGELAPLGRALRPFLFRRTKAQVLPDLPARSEQLLKCRLEGSQRRFYDQLREGYRASLLARVKSEGMARSSMHVLEALLRLRQAACAPALVMPARAKDGSAKLDLLLEHLTEVCAAGHKALVFSQFTSLLALVRERLNQAGLVHEYLDGQTRDRKACVARFQTDPACQVFAISLKAGGTGLNLTAASYVFLLDPWWNPAVEAQAIDRSHRLGQRRAVTAYRVIAENTVEDKILELQRSKRALVDGLFAEDTGKLAALTAQDLAALLAP